MSCMTRGFLEEKLLFQGLPHVGRWCLHHLCRKGRKFLWFALTANKAGSEPLIEPGRDQIWKGLLIYEQRGLFLWAVFTPKSRCANKIYIKNTDQGVDCWHMCDLGRWQRYLVACCQRCRWHCWIQVRAQLEAAGHVPNDAVPVEYCLIPKIKTHCTQ